MTKMKSTLRAHDGTNVQTDLNTYIKNADTGFYVYVRGDTLADIARLGNKTEITQKEGTQWIEALMTNAVKHPVHLGRGFRLDTLNKSTHTEAVGEYQKLEGVKAEPVVKQDKTDILQNFIDACRAQKQTDEQIIAAFRAKNYSEEVIAKYFPPQLPELPKSPAVPTL